MDQEKENLYDATKRWLQDQIQGSHPSEAYFALQALTTVEIVECARLNLLAQLDALKSRIQNAPIAVRSALGWREGELKKSSPRPKLKESCNTQFWASTLDSEVQSYCTKLKHHEGPHGVMTPCTIQPFGWFCSRDGGHDGPCAATKGVTEWE